MEAPAGPFPAYRGSEPYVYVCHASADAYRVYEIIRELYLDGFRIWYFEEGMRADTDWPEQNARRLDDCSVFLIFTSAVSVSRQDTKDELTLAHNRSKPILQIQLEELVLPRGMALFLERSQAIKAWRKDLRLVVDEAEEFLRANGLKPVADKPLLPDSVDPLPSPEGMPPHPRGNSPVSLSDTFANRIGESELLVAAVRQQLARLHGEETIQEDVFPNVLVFHGRTGVGKTGLSQRLQNWATGESFEYGEWGIWPYDPVTPVRWDFHGSAGNVRLDDLLVVLREALAGTGIVPMAFDLALGSYLEATRPGSDGNGLALSGRAADGVLRSLQRIASELALSVPAALTASEVRRLRDSVISSKRRGSLGRFEGLPVLLKRLRQLPPGAQKPDLVAETMFLLTQEIYCVTPPANRPVLVFFLDAFEGLQRHEPQFAEAAVNSMIAAMSYGLFIITSQDALNWHELNRTYLHYSGPHAWPGLASGENQHIVGRLSDNDTRQLYETHRKLNAWRMSDELVDQLVKRSDGLPLHIEAVLKLASNLEEQQPGRVFTSADLDRDLPQVVVRLMETLSERERNAFRAACVLPFFDVQLAAAVMAESGLDREGAVQGMIRHALVKPNPGSLYPFRVHDEYREQVKRDRETPGFWGDGDWKAAAQRGIAEAKRRIDTAHRDASDSAEIEALALAIQIAYEGDVNETGLEKLVTESPTIGGLSPLLPVPPESRANTDAVALLRFIHAIALPYAASTDALKPLYMSKSAVASYAGRWRAYRLRSIRRYDEALEQLRELTGRFPDDYYNYYQYAITLRQCRRFQDGIRYVEEHAPELLLRYSKGVERAHGQLEQDPTLTREYLEREKSKRFRAEREVTELVRRSRQEWVPPDEVQPFLERAASRRARGDQRNCLMILGYAYLAQPIVFDQLVESTNQLMRSHDSVAPTVAHLLALRALLTGSLSDAKAARDAVDDSQFRGAGWISVEIWLEELGYPLPPVSTQWVITYEKVRDNWLDIARGIIKRAKAHASDPPNRELLASAVWSGAAV